MSEIVEVDSTTFMDKVLNSEEPVILEFYSHACPHCKAFNAVYSHLSEVIGVKAMFTKLDVLFNEDNRQLAISRGIRGVPTIEVFYRGRVIGSVVGNHPFKNITKILEDCLDDKDENVAPHTLLHELRA
jgi:thioredoxin 1